MPSAYCLSGGGGHLCRPWGWGGLYTCSGFVEEGKTQAGQRRGCCWKAQPGQRRGCYWEAQQWPGACSDITHSQEH